MSNHDSIQGHQPIKVNFINNNNLAPTLLDANIPVPLTSNLLIPGQGTIVFEIPEGKKENNVSVILSTEKGEELQLLIESNTANFNYRNSSSEQWNKLILENAGKEIIHPTDKYDGGIDIDPACRYWISIDSINKRLRYGKGEMRLSTCLLDYQYDTPLNLFNKATKKDNQKYIFINYLKDFKVNDSIKLITLWKDPVSVEPAVHVVPPSEFTMDAAALGTATTPTSLSKECQILYGNVADFQLNTPDFPDFEQAIEYSIRTEGCIGYKILEYKKTHSPFEGESTSDYKELYLRITLGTAQGESPGIPYVMEIWPVGCASPIHHHGYTHAIIKVLRGEIDVDMYRMLPIDHKVNTPLKTATFKPNDVTYIMPEINQFHLLKNNLKNTDTCITIQCYSYSQNDDTHYANFDYIEHNEVDQFDPISDYDFLAFKAKVKEEWQAFLQDKFWMEG